VDNLGSRVDAGPDSPASRSSSGHAAFRTRSGAGCAASGAGSIHSGGRSATAG